MKVEESGSGLSAETVDQNFISAGNEGTESSLSGTSGSKFIDHDRGDSLDLQLAMDVVDIDLDAVGTSTVANITDSNSGSAADSYKSEQRTAYAAGSSSVASQLANTDIPVCPNSMNTDQDNIMLEEFIDVEALGKSNSTSIIEIPKVQNSPVSDIDVATTETVKMDENTTAQVYEFERAIADIAVQTSGSDQQLAMGFYFEKAVQASAAFEGMTTRIPGVWVNITSPDCEW